MTPGKIGIWVDQTNENPAFSQKNKGLSLYSGAQEMHHNRFQ